MEYLDAVRRHWLVAALVLLAVLLPTVLVNVLTAPSYTATTKLWVGVGGGDSITDLNQKVSTASDLMSTYPEVVKSPLVLQPVIASLGLGTDPAELAEHVTATVPNDTLVLSISVSDDDAARSAAIANAVGQQFATVVGALPQVRTSATQAVQVTVIEQAVAPVQPSSPLVLRNIGIALVLGLVLAVVVCLVVARFGPDRPRAARPSRSAAAVEWD